MEKNKTINIPYYLHKNLKIYCSNKDLKIRDFLIQIIKKEIEDDINRKNSY